MNDIKTKIFRDILAQGKDGWAKIAASMVHPVRIRIGYKLCLGSNGFLLDDSGVTPTNRAVAESEEWDFAGPKNLDDFTRGTDQLPELLVDEIKRTWAGALIAEPMNGNFDSIDQALLETGTDAKVITQVKVYAQLRRRDPPVFTGLLEDGKLPVYKGAKVMTLKHLIDFFGAVVTTPGKINLQVKAVPVYLENDSRVKIRVTADWGIELAPCRAIQLCEGSKP